MLAAAWNNTEAMLSNAHLRHFTAASSQRRKRRTMPTQWTATQTMILQRVLAHQERFLQQVAAMVAAVAAATTMPHPQCRLHTLPKRTLQIGGRIAAFRKEVRLHDKR